MTSSIREKRIAVEKEKKIARREKENAPVMVRARDEKGHFVKDDPNTPDVNEAYADGKTPKRKPRRKPAAKKAPAKKAPAKKRGRPRKVNK